MRFIQFIRPDNGQTMLPFLNDKGQAEEAANKAALIVAMSGVAAHARIHQAGMQAGRHQP